MIKKYTIFILFLIVSWTTIPAQFAPPLPEPGTAVVNGDPSEWNLSLDFFHDMFEAGKSDKPVLSKCYLRYDCATEILYILVLPEPGVKIAADEADKQWVKVHDDSNSVIFNGNSGNDGTPPDFSFINATGSPLRADGWEASMPLTKNIFYNDFHIHAQVDQSLPSGNTSTSANNQGSSGTELNLDCSVLPVEMTSFSVILNNNLAQLNWETATEINNYGFEVQRTSVDEGWAKVGFVDGHGNSSSPKFYTFTDISVAKSGSYSYRLKQIDIDGQYEYSDVVNISLNVDEITYQLNQNYPNPFNPSTTIIYTIPEQTNVKLIIYNVFGEEITRLVNDIKETGTHSIIFNAENLASGIYYYAIETDNFVSTKKLILLK